jgi:hypothetical protein
VLLNTFHTGNPVQLSVAATQPGLSFDLAESEYSTVPTGNPLQLSVAATQPGLGFHLAESEYSLQQGLLRSELWPRSIVL